MQPRAARTSRTGERALPRRGLALRPNRPLCRRRPRPCRPYAPLGGVEPPRQVAWAGSRSYDVTRERLAGVALFLDLGRLATQSAQVVQLGPPDVAAAVDLDVVDDRTVQGECTFHPHPEAHLPHGEGLSDAGP